MERRLAALAEASARIFALRNVDEALGAITEEARRIVGAHQAVCSLTVAGDIAQAIHSVSLSDKYAQWRSYDEQTTGKGIYSLVCRTNRAMRLTQAELEAHPAWHRFGDAKGRHPPLRGWLAVPLIGRDGTNLGLIQLSDKEAGEFDADDERVIGQLAHNAAIAIENHRLVEAAQAAERRFQGFAEIAQEALWESDENHVLTFISVRPGSRFEAERARLLGATRWGAAGAAADDPDWARHRADLDAHHPFDNFEYALKRAGAVPLFASISGRPRFDAAGRFCGYRGTARDVTDLRLTQQSLRASEQRFRDFASSASDWLWETDADHRFTFVSEPQGGVERLPNEGWRGKTRREMAFDGADSPAWQAHQADLDARRPFRGFEYVMNMPSGEPRILSISGRPVFDAAGNFLGYRGTSSNVTAQRRAEAHARDANERYRQIVEAANEGIWTLDANARTTFANRRMCEMLGYTAEQLAGRPVYEFTETVPGRSISARWQARERGVAEQREVLFRRKDGTRFWAQINAQPLTAEDGSFAGSLGMVADITARKAAEAALRASEQRFRDFAESSADWFWETDTQHRVHLIAGPGPVVAGFDMGSNLRTRWDIAQADPAASPWREHIEDIEARRPFRGFVYSALDSGGQRRWVSVSGKPMFDEQGQFAGYRGVSSDITVQREAEATAREADAAYRRIVENANEGIWLLDAERRTTYVNPRVTAMLGYAAAEMLGRPHWDFLPPEQREHAQLLARDDRAAVLPPREACYRHKDGSDVWVLLTTSPIAGPDGARAGVLGMLADIGERKRAERLAASSERQVADILASISDGFVALDNAWRFTHVNAAAERIWRRRAADLVGADIFATFSPGMETPFENCYREAKRSGEPVLFTAHSERFEFWTEVRGYPHAGGFMLFFRDVTEERRSHLALRRNEIALEAARAMNQRIFETSLDLIVFVDSSGTLMRVSPSALQILGYRPEEMEGLNASDFIALEDLEIARAELRAGRLTGSTRNYESRYLHKDGRVVQLSCTGVWLESEQQHLFICRDLTERIAAEERLRRSQRMEAIGQLTGGIAHDFNNILTVVMGNAEILSERLVDEKLRKLAEVSYKAAERAAALTAQLLAFARRQTLAPTAIDVEDLVLGTRELLARALGEQVQVAIETAPDLWPCTADRTQLETALLNLAVNARDAMPNGGTLTITVANRSVPASEAGADLASGDYVAIAVRDTGQGMAPETAARAFEPFFSTKDVGKGSGLGLAMVYGFAKQSGGHATIDSAPGAGTVARLFLPRAAGLAEATGIGAVPPATVGGEGTILLVEDDALVRAHVAEQVRSLGYTVFEVADARAALERLEAAGQVDLLFSDIVMPGGMNGHQLVREAQRLYPGLRALLTSGYDNAASASGPEKGTAAMTLHPGIEILAKPYPRHLLAAKLRMAIGRA